MLIIRKALVKDRSKCKICHQSIRPPSALVKIDGIRNRYGNTQINYHAICMLNQMERVADANILDWQSQFTLK